MPVAQRLCAYCQQEKVWEWNQLKLKDGSRVYVDEKGMRWAGRRCPDCERKRVKHALSLDDFHRLLIEKELIQAGYHILSQQLPFKVEKDGKIYRVIVKRACAVGDQILLDEPVTTILEDEIVVFSFQSIRILQSQQVAQIKGRCLVFPAENHQQNSASTLV